MSLKRKRLELSVRTLDSKLKKNAFTIYENVLCLLVKDYPSDIADKVTGFLKAKDYVGLIGWADPMGGALHTTAAESRAAGQLSALIKKYPFPIPGLKAFAQNQAIEKFVTAEKQCKRYNLKLRRIHNGSSPDQSLILRKMSDFIYKVIGEEPDLPRIYDQCSFGPGASVGVHGQLTNLGRKLLTKDWTCTPLALPYAISAMSRDQHIFELLLKDGPFTCMDIDLFRKKMVDRVRLVHYNKIVTVPKTVLVDRTIAVEPLLNGYLQLGVDRFLKSKLNRIGIDLRDQTRNQYLAKLGSSPGTSDPFITIDLSSASDSISYELVRKLLPPLWMSFLSSLRSTEYMLPGSDKLHSYEKFVSMGNGFCFPLETLIFASVCALYSKPNDFSVYGDDIICRQSVAKQVLKTLWRIGFRHNRKKTFLQGPFRESCGADWFMGEDVRPLTLDYEFDSLSNIIKFHNMTKQKSFWDFRFSEVREYLRGLIPLELRFVRPYKGNVFGAFEVELDMFQSSKFSRWNRDIQAWEWTEIGLRGVPDKGLRREERYPTALVIGAVRGLPSNGPFMKRRSTTLSVRRISYGGATSTWLPPEYRYI